MLVCVYVCVCMRGCKQRRLVCDRNCNNWLDHSLQYTCTCNQGKSVKMAKPIVCIFSIKKSRLTLCQFGPSCKELYRWQACAGEESQVFKLCQQNCLKLIDYGSSALEDIKESELCSSSAPVFWKKQLCFAYILRIHTHTDAHTRTHKHKRTQDFTAEQGNNSAEPPNRNHLTYCCFQTGMYP